MSSTKAKSLKLNLFCGTVYRPRPKSGCIDSWRMGRITLSKNQCGERSVQSVNLFKICYIFFFFYPRFVPDGVFTLETSASASPRGGKIYLNSVHNNVNSNSFSLPYRPKLTKGWKHFAKWHNYSPAVALFVNFDVIVVKIFFI